MLSNKKIRELAHKLSFEDIYGLEHLIQTELVKEEERLEEQYIIPSKELIDFVISFKTKDGLYPFEDLNESLVVLLISKYPDTWGKTILKWI